MRCFVLLVLLLLPSLSEQRRYSVAWRPSVTLCVCVSAVLLSAAKVMRCIQYSLLLLLLLFVVVVVVVVCCCCCCHLVVVSAAAATADAAVI